MSAAELNNCEADLPLCPAGALPMAPVTTQVCASRAIWLTGSRNSGSLAKKGAGDSGHTIKSTLPGFESGAPDVVAASAFRLRSDSSRSVRSKASRVQPASAGMFSCTSSAV